MRWFIKNLLPLPRILWWLVLIGLLLRLPFIPIIGFKQDFLFLVSWADYLAKSSPINIYTDVNQVSVQFVNYPPLYLYILTILARLYRYFTAAPFDHIAFLCLIKSVTVFFEILTAFSLYFWSSKQGDRRTGVWAFCLYFLNPALFYVSVYYGQLDAIFSAFLLLAMIAYSRDRFVWCGSALAVALLLKLQTLPFIPLFFCVALFQRKYRSLIGMTIGLAVTGWIILSPYWFHGQIQAFLEQCVFKSFQWGKFITVGAFNLWYLHADPITFDERIWGVFFDSNGILQTHALLSRLTYKNLGIALFGCAFLLTLFGVWKPKRDHSPWIAAMHIALAFFMLPTKVHERYLFPYFVLAAPLAAENRYRRFFFYAFSSTYLVNLMVVCPLIGQSVDVRDIDSNLGVGIAFVNVILYAVFIAYEYAIPYAPRHRFSLMFKTVGITLLCGILVLIWRASARLTDPDILYLSSLKPVFVEQDWPLIPPELINQPQNGFEQLKADLSTAERQLQIGNTVYRYGLGAHAISRVEFEVPGKYQLFECYAGVDVEAMDKYEQTPDVATVTFTVWVNDQQRFVTPLTIPTTPARKISVLLPENREGTNRIQLVVDGTPDGIDSDHADWAMARVIRITPYR